MFGFGKGSEKDPKKALDNADNAINKGLSGALVKGFMGKDFVDKSNAAINMGKQALDAQQQAQWLAQAGMDATADVLEIADTGMLVNYNPVVMLKLSVQPAAGAAFQTAGQVTVSKIAVPRVGDKIKIKYNPADPTQFVVM